MSIRAEVVDFGIGSYAVHWREQNIHVFVEYLSRERQGIICEVSIRHGDVLLCESLRCNLNSEAKTKSIAKKVHDCGGHLSLAEWARLIESTCVLILRRFRQGEPPTSLTKDTVVPPLTFAINPLVTRNKPVIMFADGGKGKSTLALLMAMLVSTGESVAGLTALKGTSLFLDWEDDADVHARRLQAIQRAHDELIKAEVQYQRCCEPLEKLTHDLARTVQTNGITFVVVDSIVAACGGDSSAEAIGKFFAALRVFNVSSLCLGHVAKSLGEGQAHATVYGSVFNQNYSRGIWELKTEQEIGDNTAILGLFHHKGNHTRKHHAIGLKVTHNEQGSWIQYEGFDLNKAAELEKSLPIRNRIDNLLLSDRVWRTTKEIADALGVKQETVQVNLSRHRQQYENRDTKWMVLSS